MSLEQFHPAAGGTLTPGTSPAMPPQAPEGEDRLHGLLAHLRAFLAGREAQRTGVYLPLVRVDGRD